MKVGLFYRPLLSLPQLEADFVGQSDLELVLLACHRAPHSHPEAQGSPCTHGSLLMAQGWKLKAKQGLLFEADLMNKYSHNSILCSMHITGKRGLWAVPGVKYSWDSSLNKFPTLLKIQCPCVKWGFGED